MTFTVTLSAASDEEVSVNCATNNWSAKAGQDYVATSEKVTFAPGETTRTFAVTVKGDKKREADERFFVSMSDISSNAMVSYYEGSGNILNDDGGGRANRRNGCSSRRPKRRGR
jgi:hypothetical protein